MPQHVFIPLLCIRYNILDRVSMIKAFAYCFPGVLLPLFQAEQHLRTFFKTSLTIFPCCGIVIKSTTWARSSAGRAFGSHPRGRGFDPLRVHQFAASFCTMRRFLCLKNFGRPCRAPNPEVGCEPGGVINIFLKIHRFHASFFAFCRVLRASASLLCPLLGNFFKNFRAIVG